MGLCSLPVRCLAWGVPCPERQTSPGAHGLYGRAKEDLCQHAPPRTAAAAGAPVCIADHTANAPLRRRPSSTGRQIWLRLLSPGSWCTQGFVCALHESLFPQVPWKFCNQIPLSFKVRFPGDSQSLCQILRLGSLMWGLEHLQQCEKFFGTIVLPVCGSPTWRVILMWLHPPTISLLLLLCPWTWSIFFGGLQRPPVDGCCS